MGIRQQLLDAIVSNQRKIAEANTTKCSKTGVKWIRAVARDNIRRLRAQLKELPREPRHDKVYRQGTAWLDAIARGEIDG